jgi:uncharacterized protein YdcH (DUF465 family)
MVRSGEITIESSLRSRYHRCVEQPKEGYVQLATEQLSRQEQLARLTDQHRALKERLKELDKHLSLTSAEQVERAQLKKMKLRTKERILRLQGY